MSKGTADQIGNPEVVVRPLSNKALEVTNYLALRADQSSRLVNEFGRAFLKKVIPNLKLAEASGQMLLKL